MNEASSARAARMLQAAGVTRVKALRGGLDGWRAAGYPVETVEASASAAAG
jgi:3-mercaptopyruvate sulfurtransferase SseA